MSQELRTVKKQMSFEDICPRWSQVIHKISKTNKTIFKMEHKMIDIGVALTCVVGEAHGFNDAYWEDCGRCRNYSGKFASLLIKTPSHRRRSIERFVNHFNKFHN